MGNTFLLVAFTRDLKALYNFQGRWIAYEDFLTYAVRFAAIVGPITVSSEAFTGEALISRVISTCPSAAGNH